MIKDAITTWIAKCERPLSIVEDKELEHAFQVASECSTYTMPSRYVITKTLEESYQTHKSALLTQLSSLSDRSVGITLDYWTSIANESYLGVTCHFIHDWKLISKVLTVKPSKGRHTSDIVKIQIEEVVTEWGLEDKVAALVTDNAAKPSPYHTTA